MAWWHRHRKEPVPEIVTVVIDPEPPADGVSIEEEGGKFYLRLRNGRRIGPYPKYDIEERLDYMQNIDRAEPLLPDPAYEVANSAPIP